MLIIFWNSVLKLVSLIKTQIVFRSLWLSTAIYLYIHLWSIYLVYEVNRKSPTITGEMRQPKE